MSRWSSSKTTILGETSGPEARETGIFTVNPDCLLFCCCCILLFIKPKISGSRSTLIASSLVPDRGESTCSELFPYVKSPRMCCVGSHNELLLAALGVTLPHWGALALKPEPPVSA